MAKPAKPLVSNQVVRRVEQDALNHWQAGYNHYYLSVDGPGATASLLQVVENVGWKLQHAGWVWAEKGYVGVGGFGMLNSNVVGNYLFGRPEGDSPHQDIPNDV